MSDDVSGLIRGLDEAMALLESAGETHWQTWLKQDRQRILAGDAYGLEHLLQAFGGMGSFNDLVLHEANGHVGDHAALRAANDRLRDLRSEIHDQAQGLLHELHSR